MAKKADKTDVHLWIEGSYAKVTKEWSSEVDRNKADFDMFRSKDFPALQERVTKLEKLLQRLQHAMENLKIPEGGNPENDRLILELT